MNLAKTVQLDPSDLHIFDRPAVIGEWAIAGTFSFVDSDPAAWSKKQKLAFRSAWLGIGSFGHSTFVQATAISSAEYEQLLLTLTAHLTDQYRAPNLEAATDAAKQEIDDMATLCNHPPGTLLAIERDIDGQNITEQTRIISGSRDQAKPKIWTAIED
jgi:hypothetical protein